MGWGIEPMNNEPNTAAIEAAARNIVNQLMDEVSHWVHPSDAKQFVDFRQANNDKWDAFTKKVIYESAKAAEWVKCEDELPKRPAVYYVAFPDGSTGRSAFYVGSFDRSVIAWMPLPEYKPVLGDSDYQSGHSMNADGTCNMGRC